MKIERTKNAARNISYKVPLTLYNLILPFITKTIFIRIMGMEYLGLGSLFTSILSVLNLAELGVGSAMTFSMYKPIADDDTEKICALMKLYKIYYRIIGGVILVIGLILTPFIPKLITGNIPADINIYILYLMHLGITVITYWLFAYKNCLIYAHQRDDISSKISFIILTVTNIAQLFVIYITKNYYLYVLVSMVTGAISNIITAKVVDKKFPNYHAFGKLPKSEIKIINGRVKDLFTAKLGSTVINSADSIVISSFLGLKTLAMYNNYYYIMTSIQSFVSIILTACAAGIGNSLVVETKEKNFNDLKKLTLLLCWISCFCVCCFACIYQPFMEIWVGKSNMLSYDFVILFCTYFYFGVFTTILFQYKDAAGIWRSDKYRVLVSSLSNLIMNIIMVNYWGLYGVLLSTIISTVCISVPWLFHNLFKDVFDKKYLKPYLIKTIIYLIITIVCLIICVLISTLFLTFESLILTIIARGVICCIIPNIIWFLIFKNSNEFTQLIVMLNVITKGQLCILKKLIK